MELEATVEDSNVDDSCAPTLAEAMLDASMRVCDGD